MKTRQLPAISVFLIALLAAPCALAESQDAFVYPCHKLQKTIKVDGVVDPQEWSGITRVSGFTLTRTRELVLEQSVFMAAYDEQALYIGVINIEPLMGTIKFTVPEHASGALAVINIEPLMGTIKARVRHWDGPVWRDDAVEVFLDVGHTETRYFQFIMNSVGAGYDGKNLNPLWSGRWKCAASKDKRRW